VLLSYSLEKEISNYFMEPIQKRTNHTITDFDGFMREAEKIRKSGYAIDNEEFANGIYCIATPIFDCMGNVVAAIGISTLSIYDDLDSLINQKFAILKKAADEISLCLGKPSI
jgi:DNA-binding IclR family transcriptional regulator